MTPERCVQPPQGAAALAAQSHRASIPVLETARLRLRAPTLDDLPAWTEIYTGPASEGIGGPYDAEQAWSEFSCYTACWMLHGYGLWAVELQGGPLVGFVQVGLEWGDEEPELGWMFLPQFHGNGYATEAAMAAREHALSVLPNLVSYVDPPNGASNRVAERLGARRDTAVEARMAVRHGEAIHVWRHAGTL